MFGGNRRRRNASGDPDDDPNYDSNDRAFRENMDIKGSDMLNDSDLPDPEMFTSPPPGSGQNRPSYGGSENAACNFFVSWFMLLCESCCGFNASLTKQNIFGPTGLYVYGICLGWIAIIDGFASIILKIYRMIIRSVSWFWQAMIVTSYGGVPAILWYIAIFVILFLLATFWQVILLYIIKFIIPLLNLLIVLWNFFIRLFFILYRLTATIWNIFVPFIGMIIFVVVKLLVTVLQIVFDLLASDGFMSIIQSLMEVIIAIVEIVLGILMKLIQLGMPLLKIVAQILPIILEVVFTIIEVALEIVVWIINLLFKLISPILEIISAFFSAFTFAALAASSNKMSRKLFSKATGIDESHLRTLYALGMGAAALTHMQKALLLSGKVDGFNEEMFAARYEANPNAHSDEWTTFIEYAYVQGLQTIDVTPNFSYTDLDHKWDEFVTDTSENITTAKPQFNRKPLAYGDVAIGDLDNLEALDMRKMSAVMPKSVEEMRIESSRAKASERTRSATAASSRNAEGDLPEVLPPPNVMASSKKDINLGDRNSQILSDSFHNYAYSKTNEGDTQWLDVAHYTMNRINKHNSRGLGRTNPIIYLKKARQLHPDLFNQASPLSSLRYVTLEHPGELYVQLLEPRRNYVKANGLEYDTWKKYEENLKSRGVSGGRYLLNLEQVSQQVDPVEHSRYLYLREMEINDGRKIAQAAKNHEDYSVRHIVAVQAIGNGITRDVHYFANNIVHPDKLAKHVNTAVNYYGYESVQHAFDHFMKFHVEGGVVRTLTLSDWPGFSFFKGFGEDPDAKPRFRGWNVEEDELKQMRPKSVRQDRMTRRLLAYKSDSERAYAQEEEIKSNADKRGAQATDSSGAFEGLEIITEGDCFSEDKNPLCLPIPRPDIAELFQIGLIKLDERITEDSNLCDPWLVETLKDPSWLPFIFRWMLTHIYNTGVSIAFVISAFPPSNILLTSFKLLFPFLSWTVDWIFIVPPNRYASFAQVYCWFANLFSVMVTWYLWLIFRYIVYELFLLAIEIITDLCAKPRNEERELTSRWLEQQSNNPALRKALYEAALFRKIIDREHKREEAASRHQVNMMEYDNIDDIEMLRDTSLIQGEIGDMHGDMPGHHARALKLHLHHHSKYMSQEAMVHELRHLSGVLSFAQQAQDNPDLIRQLCDYISMVVLRVDHSAYSHGIEMDVDEDGIVRGHHIEAHVVLQEMFPSLFGINKSQPRRIKSDNMAASSSNSSSEFGSPYDRV